MQAQLKDLMLSNGRHFEEFTPADIHDFALDICLMIGPKGEEGAESFSLTVCTPEWLKRECSDVGYLWRWDLMVVNEYNRVEIKKIIERFVSRCVAPTWIEIAAQMARRSHWEFDNYT